METKLNGKISDSSLKALTVLPTIVAMIKPVLKKNMKLRMLSIKDVKA